MYTNDIIDRLNFKDLQIKRMVQRYKIINKANIVDIRESINDTKPKQVFDINVQIN